MYIQIYLGSRRSDLSRSLLYVVCQKMYGKIEINFNLFYLTLRLSATNSEVVISPEKR